MLSRIYFSLAPGLTTLNSKRLPLPWKEGTEFKAVLKVLREEVLEGNIKN